MSSRYASRGVTLLETLVLFILLNTLMLITVGWITQSLRFSSAMQDRYDQHQTWMRLSRDLRRDVHRGSEVEVLESGGLAITAPGGERVVYSRHPGHLRRESSASSASARHESYPFEDELQVQWNGDQLPRWIEINLQGPRRADNLRVRAAVGRLLPRPPSNRPATDDIGAGP
ncbi:PulJ/GspJ family protein [Roseimaritima sediminicola]|uniref:PulJ/GspJ family protein n=1 Tax=Roseimaritima sediminicola TaxID=2662066 RepID=UPI0012982FCF|nr:hypothetical protein [Roseimaritima sediminicola]